MFSSTRCNFKLLFCSSSEECVLVDHRPRHWPVLTEAFFWGLFESFARVQGDGKSREMVDQSADRCTVFMWRAMQAGQMDDFCWQFREARCTRARDSTKTTFRRGRED